MQLMIHTNPQEGASYTQQSQLAKAAEEWGFDGYFRSDHLLGLGSGSGYSGQTEAWTTLAGLACETSRIRLGTLVSPVTFRHPGMLAVQVAQVDQMSGGRVELGLGAGWFRREHLCYGIPFPNLRFQMLEEQLQIVTGMLSTDADETFSFSGSFYQLVGCPGSSSGIQGTMPPVIVGGIGKRRTPLLAARYAREFNTPAPGCHDSIGRVSAACERLGRPLSSLRCSVWAPVVCGRDESGVRRRILSSGGDREFLEGNGFVGTPSAMVDWIGNLSDDGVSRVYLQLADLTDFEHVELMADTVLRQVQEI